MAKNGVTADSATEYQTPGDNLEESILFMEKLLDAVLSQLPTDSHNAYLRSAVGTVVYLCGPQAQAALSKWRNAMQADIECVQQQHAYEIAERERVLKATNPFTRFD